MLLPPPGSRYLLAALINISLRSVLHKFSSTPLRVACPFHLISFPYHNSNICYHPTFRSLSLCNSGHSLLCPHHSVLKKVHVLPFACPKSQTISGRLPTTEISLGSQEKQCEICASPSGTGTCNWSTVRCNATSYIHYPSDGNGPITCCSPQRNSFTAIKGNTNQ
jgi:hypothetical protein